MAAENLYKVITPFDISPAALRCPAAPGQVLSFKAGDVVKIAGQHQMGKSGTTMYWIPITCVDGSVAVASVEAADFQKVSLTCGSGADASASTDPSVDFGECINPNTPVIDNDPAGKAVIPGATVLGMTPALGWTVIAAVSGLVIWGFVELLKHKK